MLKRWPPVKCIPAGLITGNAKEPQWVERLQHFRTLVVLKFGVGGSVLHKKKYKFIHCVWQFHSNKTYFEGSSASHSFVRIIDCVPVPSLSSFLHLLLAEPHHFNSLETGPKPPLCFSSSSSSSSLLLLLLSYGSIAHQIGSHLLTSKSCPFFYRK